MGIMRRRYDTRVFVDDFVLGRLPGVCVFTGEPADGRLVHRSRLGNPNPLLLLLIFLGPIGWIILAFLALRAGRDLVGELPITKAKWDQLRRVRRTMWGMLLAGFACAAATIPAAASRPQQAVLVIAAIGLVVAAAGTKIWLGFQEPTVRLDASGRWVTLQSVSSEFADAVARRRRQAESATFPRAGAPTH